MVRAVRPAPPLQASRSASAVEPLEQAAPLPVHAVERPADVGLVGGGDRLPRRVEVLSRCCVLRHRVLLSDRIRLAYIESRRPKEPLRRACESSKKRAEG